MNHLKAVLALYCGGFFCAHGVVLAVDVAPSSTLLLLRNGRVLQGEIEHEADRYRVRLSNGEIHVHQREVTAVCADLPAAYQALLATGQSQSVEHRLRIAVWCIDQRLYEQATAELELAKSMSPKDRRIEYVARRLQLAQEPPPSTQPVERQASTPELITHEELNRLVRSLPKGTPEQFADVVQPILLSRCATSRCHGLAADQPLRLIRPPTNKSQASRITQRNLNSVLDFVDHAHPHDSRLLRAASEPHGESAHPPLSEHEQMQLAELADWVKAVTATERQSRDPHTPPATISLSRPDPWGNSQLNQMQGPQEFQSHFPNPVQRAESQSGFTPAGAEQRDPRAPQRRFGARPPTKNAKPNDPFDPAHFNRQFFPGEATP